MANCCVEYFILWLSFLLLQPDFISPFHETKISEPLRVSYWKENGNCFALNSIANDSNVGEI